MNTVLFRLNIKRNWGLFTIFFAVLMMYSFVMVVMFDPEDIESLVAMLKLLPESLMKAFGFSQVVTDFTSYLASWLYGSLMLGFPMVYAIILGNRLVARMVDDGSFSYLLSSPNSRTGIIVTQGAFALCAMFFMFLIVWLLQLLICEVFHPGLLDRAAFFNLTLATMLVNSLVVMICFFFSCLFNESRYALGFGTGIPLGFFMMKMIGEVNQDTGFLKRISIYGFFDPVALARGASATIANIAYCMLILALFVVSVLVFRKKQLPL
jgi:ABC-2 type transport system permease protein